MVGMLCRLSALSIGSRLRGNDGGGSYNSSIEKMRRCSRIA
jgi:hypothetical protein